jgi:hypothetical protein
MCSERSFAPECIDSTVPFNLLHRHAGLAEQSQLLSEHSNAIIYKYTDTTQLLHKRRKSRKKVQNSNDNNNNNNNNNSHCD